MSTKAEQLIQAAIELFDERGYHATGIDAILARAGVAKMTLYNNFGTKDELIVAALREAGRRSRDRIIRSIESRASDPKGRLLALFDFAGDWIGEETFRGCMFLRAAGEFGDEDPVRAVCAEHAELMSRHLAGLGVQAGASDPEVLARELMLLFHGALASGNACCGEQVTKTAKSAARLIIDQHLGARGSSSQGAA